VHPSPRTHGGPGKRAEILLDRQLALLISSDKVVRTVAVSSGTPSTPTPQGYMRVPATRAKPHHYAQSRMNRWLSCALVLDGLAGVVAGFAAPGSDAGLDSDDGDNEGDQRVGPP
jgi:hypothetical protein